MRRLKQDAFEIVERHSGTVNEFGEDRIVLLFGVPDEPGGSLCPLPSAPPSSCARFCDRWRETQPAARGLALAHRDRQPETPRFSGWKAPSCPTGSPGGRPRGRRSSCAHAGRDEILISPEGRARRRCRCSICVQAEPGVATQRRSPFTPLRVLARGDARAIDWSNWRARRTLTAFTGRARDLAALVAAYEEARAGRGRVVTVTGEAGLGKSRLLLEFRRTIDPAAATVLVGRCSSYGQATAYMPWLDVRVADSRGRGRRRGLTATDIGCRRARDRPRSGAGAFRAVLSALAVDPDREIPPLEFRVKKNSGRSAFQEALVAMLLAAAKQATAASCCSRTGTGWIPRRMRC